MFSRCTKFLLVGTSETLARAATCRYIIGSKKVKSSTKYSDADNWLNNNPNL